MKYLTLRELHRKAGELISAWDNATIEQQENGNFVDPDSVVSVKLSDWDYKVPNESTKVEILEDAGVESDSFFCGVQRHFVIDCT
jgi:hypothetical protein